MSAQDVYNYVMSYINGTGVGHSYWYVGIATNPKDRLFKDHNVSEKSGIWVYTNAGSENAARQVEKFIIDTHRTKGDTGGGDESTTYVYAYVITQNTVE